MNRKAATLLHLHLLLVLMLLQLIRMLLLLVHEMAAELGVRARMLAGVLLGFTAET